jgi:2-polyprenyl-3-methyl-5-hydroxy-6-metoxy-1,4-benzoquinol methylase
MTEGSFIDANRANWDERVESHLIAYGANAFADDPDALSKVVEDDLSEMSPYLPGGSASGLKLLHLQCHIGTDTLSWARLGADVVGTDFSAEAIRAARTLADRAQVSARFEQCANEDAPAILNDTFDVVYTSVGVLMWLPRLDTWAAAVHQLLKPGGVFYVRDSHPVLHAIDQDRTDGLLVLRQPYFETDQPSRDDSGTTYAGDDLQVGSPTTYEWSHSLSEVIQSLIDAGLRIISFTEGKTLPWRALPSLVESPDGYIHPENPSALPLEFSVTARRDA